MDLRVHPAVRTLSPEYLEEAAQADAKPKPVILAPFGLAATLTGQSFRAMDSTTQKALDDWSIFYPLCNKENSNLPPFVEVISGMYHLYRINFRHIWITFSPNNFVGGVKMRYPSKYVLVTDMDDEQFSTKCSGPPVTENFNRDLGNQTTMHMPLGPASVLSERVWQNCITNPVIVCSAKDDNGSGAITENSTNQKSVWEYADPTQKATCVCTK